MDVVFYNGLRFRKDKKTGYYLSSKNVEGRRIRLHRYVWECEFGPVPDGFHVHHKDEDKDNNDPKNLKLVDSSQHAKIHWESNYEERKAVAKVNMNKAMNQAKEWHKSEEGNEWHKEQYDKIKDKLHEKVERLCTTCGVPVMTNRKNVDLFCSNNCKTKHRYKSGVDNEDRVCEMCGLTFSVNKYTKARCCSRECGAKLSGKIRKKS